MRQERFYRNIINKNYLTTFRVIVKETDLFIHADNNLEDITKELVLLYRGHLEAYIKEHPDFLTTLVPWKLNIPAASIVTDMVKKSSTAGVGPMASVAGAIAQFVGNDLLSYTNEVIVENGGDIFLKVDKPIKVGIFAGESPLSLKVGIRMNYINKPISVCTSSGTVGPSLSFGKADAVCIISESCSLADAAATAIGNIVKSAKDISQAISMGKKINGVLGILIIIGDKIGAYGDIELVRI